MLDMGKLESGEVVLEQQPFNLQEIIDEVGNVIEKLATEQNIEFITEAFEVQHWNLIGSGSHAGTIPIIAMTANAFTEDRIKSREAGMSAHVSKPLNMDLVIKTINKLIGYNS